jgi:hypothetical protein
MLSHLNRLASERGTGELKVTREITGIANSFKVVAYVNQWHPEYEKVKQLSGIPNSNKL